MFARTRALGVAFAITLVAGLALAQQSTVGGSSSRPRYQQVTIAGALEPNLVQCSTGAASTNRCWLYRLDTNGDFRLVLANDAAAGVTNAINIDRTGTTVDSITLQATSVVDSHATQPILRLTNSGAPADSKNLLLRTGSSTGDFAISLATDAAPDVAFTNAMVIDRTGTTVDSINLSATSVQANGVPVATVVTGSFTMTLTGCTANPNVTAEYYIVSGTAANTSVVTLMIPSVSCTSNATTATLTGLPAAIQPSAQGGIQTCAPIRNNTAPAFGHLQLQIGSPTLIDLGAVCGTSGGFTAAGTKGTNGGGPIIITYPLT